jgi:hypothetical protein
MFKDTKAFSGFAGDRARGVEFERYDDVPRILRGLACPAHL